MKNFTQQKYGGDEKIEVQQKPTAPKVKGSTEWPAGWKPLTDETYCKLVTWRRDRTTAKGTVNYTPSLQTHLAFDVREFPLSDRMCRIGFPYKLHGAIENIKVLDFAVEQVGDGQYRAVRTKDKKGKLVVERKYWLLDGTPKNLGVLFGVDKYLHTDTVYSLNDLDTAVPYRAGEEEPPAAQVGDMHITEGEWDTMCLWEQGYNAVSVLNAGQTTAIEPAILEMLGWYDNLWFDLDNDKDGRACKDRLATVLPNAQALRFGSCKDACEYYARGGAKALRALIDEQANELRSPLTGAALLATAKVKDWPEDVLDGVLGDICKRRMLNDFPISYAWPALVTVAGALVPTNGDRTNWNMALIGPPHNGKTKATDRALQLLGFNPDPEAVSNKPKGEPLFTVDDGLTETQWRELRGSVLITEKVGSAEGLADHIGNAGHAHRLWYPGELSHTLGKAMITNASFPSVICDAFDKDNNSLVIEKQKRIAFSCQLSIMGGIVTTNFGNVFGAESIYGVYDRFLFGQNPTDWEIGWIDLHVEAEALPALSPVHIPLETGRAMTDWSRQNGVTSRVMLVALRVAATCASFNGKATLLEADLGPAKALALEQERIRLLLKPNEGQSAEGRVTDSLMAYLERHSPHGEWLDRNELYRNTLAYKLGVGLADRVITSLSVTLGVVETRDVTPPRGGRKLRQIRLVPR